MITYKQDFIRVASCSPAVSVANPSANAKAILDVLRRAKEQGARLAVLPELAITGYTCGDLFHNSLLLQRVEEAMEEVIDFVDQNDIDIVVLTIPKNGAVDVTGQLVKHGVKAIWNFAHVDLDVPEDVIVENVHLSDSLMKLSYKINRRKREENGGKNKSVR